MKNLDLIKKALNEVLLEEEAEITKQLSAAESPSDEFYSRLDKIYNEIAEDRKRNISFKKAITAAIIAAVILASFSLSALAFGEEIKGFIIEFFDGFARLTPSDDERDFVDARNISIGYIPEGFSQTQSTGSDSSGLRVWSSENKSITLIYNQYVGAKFLDTENSDYTTLKLDDLTIYRTEKHGHTHVLWTDGRLVYSLTCTGVEWEEMVKIIEGITLTESE